MIKKLVFGFLIASGFAAIGQKKNISYFDEKGRLTYEESAFYYRESTDTANYFRSYYAKYKTKYFEGYILNASDTADYNNKYNGLCKWYYTNGKIKRQSEYNNEGILSGVRSDYNLRGQLIKKTEYINGKILNDRYLEYDSLGHTSYVLKDDFVDNAFNWPISLETGKTSKIKIGGLELINTTDIDSYVLKDVKIDSLNYSIETLINSLYLLPDTKTGVVFGYKDLDNYNYYYITNSKFSVGFRKNGVNYNTIEDFFTPDLNNFNKLKIVSIEDSIYFFINDKLQTYCQTSKLVGDKIGFYVNKGNSFFESFIIKEGNINLNLVDKKHLMSYKINGHMKTINDVYSGVFIGKTGIVLTEIKNLNRVNKILVETCINDTLKLYEADVLKDDFIYNYTLLKIRIDTLGTVNLTYNYNPLRKLDPLKKAFIYYFEKDSLSRLFKPVTIEVVPKSITGIHVSAGNNIKVGSPIFDADGNILGLVSDIDRKNKVTHTPISSIFGYFMMKPELINLINIKAFDLDNFHKNIFSNIVIIKTL